ncbi:hypothetical protein ACLOJK_025993 [Asimina triloba]
MGTGSRSDEDQITRIKIDSQKYDEQLEIVVSQTSNLEQSVHNLDHNFQTLDASIRQMQSDEDQITRIKVDSQQHDEKLEIVVSQTSNLEKKVHNLDHNIQTLDASIRQTQ